MLTKPFMPPSGAARMSGVGDVRGARKRFYGSEHSTLRYLLEKRYGWMNRYIEPGSVGLEIGAGAGLSREFIKVGQYEMTDFAEFEWLDRKVDALDLPYKDDSLDFIFESNVLHHLCSPAKFLGEARRTLKVGGRLLIQDVWGSLLLRGLCRVLKTEGYSFNVDVFDDGALCCDPENLWAGNNVIPNLLFSNPERISNEFGFRVQYMNHSEVLLFPLSGGVTSHLPSPKLPRAILNATNFIDSMLVKYFPNIFALQVSVVLQKA